MDMTSVLVSVGIGLALAALALTSNLVSIYFDLRGSDQPGRRPGKVFGARSAPVPFNYPLLLRREASGEVDPQISEKSSEEDPADWWKKA